MIKASDVHCLVFAALLAIGPAMAQPASSLLSIEDVTGHAKRLTSDDLARLPQQRMEVAFATEHGPRSASFSGPLLWDVLAAAGAIDPAKPRDHVRQSVLATGNDHYTALLALGELDPAFEGKRIIVAAALDGKPLGQPRLVVPGDQHGGRSVHDLISLTVDQPAR